MNGREIPGYYYDPTKQKYFKIQAHHQVPTGSKYSRSTVTHVRAEEEQERKASADAAERKKSHVQRSHVLQHAGVAGVGLERETAQRVRSRRATFDVKAKAYGGGMEVEWERNWERLVGKDVISTFAYDDVTGDIMVGE